MSAAPQEPGERRISRHLAANGLVLRNAWILLAVSALLWYSTFRALFAGPFSRIDFNCFYLWGLAARSGTNPYVVNLQPLAHSLNLTTEGMDLADYPPVFVLGFEPLSCLSPNHAYLAWTLINALALIGSLWLLLRHQQEITGFRRIILVGLVLFYFPLTYHTYWAQVQLIILLLVVIANRYLDQQRDASAGIAIAAGGLLKIFPFYLLGYVLFARRWRALYCSCLAIILGSLVAILFLGFAPRADFLVRLFQRLEGGWLAEHKLTEGPNLIALGPVASRIYQSLVDSHASGQILRRLFIFTPQLLILGISIYSTIKTSDQPIRREAAFALWTVTIVLVSPTACIHYWYC